MIPTLWIAYLLTSVQVEWMPVGPDRIQVRVSLVAPVVGVFASTGWVSQSRVQ